ncbi:hypothetical protein EMCG_04254 [[Emmonsia] crescens]|uniref:Uncharacterized protein n=1 Tax=[Emmonsia] crescens TaxID=73230 RepID=A0A0G2IZ46_9EURO|nr:hypothetical protein EMCG_04254 [Emmonsia crescens UAMH 3008]
MVQVESSVNLVKHRAPTSCLGDVLRLVCKEGLMVQMQRWMNTSSRRESCEERDPAQTTAIRCMRLYLMTQRPPKLGSRRKNVKYPTWTWDVRIFKHHFARKGRQVGSF